MNLLIARLRIAVLQVERSKRYNIIQTTLRCPKKITRLTLSHVQTL